MRPEESMKYRQYEQFDDELLKLDFLKRHNECLPYIGENYASTRLLLIGESHYVPKKAVEFVKRPDFYSISFDDLPKGDYKTWINTRDVFHYRVYQNERFENFFSNTASEIAKIIYKTSYPSKEQKITAMHQYAFMNYFKRPSYEEGKTIRELVDDDFKIAYDVTCHIIDVLDPRLIIFLSKKSYYKFCESDKGGYVSKYTVKAVSHPSCRWWNKKRKDGRCAKEEFYDYLLEIL